MYMYPEKRKILVVEDEADIRQVLCFFLKHSGFEVCGAANGLEAIGRIPEFAPDLIVLDILMRPLNGWDVLHWLRDHYPKPLPPVLVLTALAHTAEQMHGFEEGAVEYLTKPTQPTTIVERVQALLALTAEQRSMLQRNRLDEHRRTLERLYAAQQDELIY